MLNYYIPEGKGGDNETNVKFTRKSEIYDCCENTLILRTYAGIIKRIKEQMGGES